MQVSELSDLPPTLTVAEAARLLGVSERSGYRAVAAGQLPIITVAATMRVPTSRLLEMLGVPVDCSRGTGTGR